MADLHQGRCFCGAIEIEARGEPLEMGYCHCSSCRSYSGAPVSAFLLWKSDDVKVTMGADLIGRFMKTPLSERQHCTQCGGHLMTYHPDLGLTDVRPAAMPDLFFEPVVHLHYAETVLRIRDGLPKLRDFPASVGGSGQFIAE